MVYTAETVAGRSRKESLLWQAGRSQGTGTTHDLCPTDGFEQELRYRAAQDRDHHRASCSPGACSIL